jgi:hypothetical protein
MKRQSAYILAVLTISLLCVVNVYSYGVARAQEEDTLSEHALHVTYNDLTISFRPMDSRSKQSGLGFTIPSVMVVKQAAKDSERVTYIEVEAIRNGELWWIVVSVTFGEFYDQGKKHIATYQIRVNEKAHVKELAQYGITPFDVSVVRTQRVAPVQPTVINKTTSIQVLHVKAAALPMPYRITLKNTSDKAVQALEIVTSNGRGASALKWPEDLQDRPLIGAGQEYKVEMPSEKEYRSLPTSQYVSDQLSIIEINTVVFTDGTYEGDPTLAGLQNAGMLGSKLQLDKILSLIKTALETDNADYAFSQFKTAASELEETIEPSLLEELMRQFPTLSESRRNGMLNSARRKLHDIKTGLKNAVAEFERGAQQKASGSFKEWLESRKEMYESWRARLP